MRDSSSQEIKTLGGDGKRERRRRSRWAAGGNKRGKRRTQVLQEKGCIENRWEEIGYRSISRAQAWAKTGVHIYTHQEPGQQRQRIRPHTRHLHSIRATHQTHIYMQAQPHTRNTAEKRTKRAQRLYTYVAGCAIRRHDSP